MTTTADLAPCANKDCTEPLFGWVDLIPLDPTNPDLTDSLPIPLCEDCLIRVADARQKRSTGNEAASA